MKQINKSTKLSILGIVISLFNATAHAVNVPNTFTANTPASASEVNANFTALSNAVDNNASNLLSVVTALDSAYRYTSVYYSWVNYSTTYGTSLSEVVTASCPAGSIMVGGGVSCSGDSTNFSLTNFGVINSSIPAGNSMIGSCAANALSYTSLKDGPGVTVRVVCLSPDIIPNQAAKGGGTSTPGQGVPSDEALLMIEQIRAEAVAQQTAISQ